MLELKNITKIYPAGGENIHALRDVSLQFRSKEFVSVLGPSGCGKTTLLNVIGGLDQYTSGDLVIQGRSTKDFKDRDWDAYRNHSIGFVFQSYNLIPHQSVLRNVELALTLSGISKKERIARAKEALIKVGLEDQMKKRPSEMSGGQMQRVAIARAIVNNPRIILADEPTGALDTENSVQIMEILKEISQDHLVVMVTHNPFLAERYSTRIIRMVDGRIIGDSKPLSHDELLNESNRKQAQANSDKNKKMPSMSLKTSFGLSFRNLLAKKGRTILTSFAGSIGIIGIALIYAVSSGATSFINSVQEDTLSSYPLVLEAQHVDTASLITTFLGKAQSATPHQDDGVYQKAMVYELMNALNSGESQRNDLKSFKEHLEAARADEDLNHPLKTAVSGVQYGYDMNMQVYTRNVDGKVIISDLQKMMREMFGKAAHTDLTGVTTMMDNARTGTQNAMMNTVSLWREMLPGENGKLMSSLFEKQYDLLYGSWPTRYDEILLVADKDGELPDLTLYALGLISEEDMGRVMNAAMNREVIDYDARGWSYQEICDLDFRVVLNSDCYIRDTESGLYTDLRASEAGMQYLYDNGLKLRVSGVIRPAKDAVATMMTGGIAYTSKLTEYIVNQCNRSEVVKAQLSTPQTDILTGLPFRDHHSMTVEQKAQAFRSHFSMLNETEKANAYISFKSVPSQTLIRQTVTEYCAGTKRKEKEKMLLDVLSKQMSMNEDALEAYIAGRSEDELFEMLVQIMAPQLQANYTNIALTQLRKKSAAQLASEFDQEMESASNEQCSDFYDKLLTFSDSSLENNLKQTGYVDLDSPSTISLYTSTFEGKDIIEDAIAAYNQTVSDPEEITYTDYIGLMMSSVTTIIKAITYVLIAFVAISLIVSSIMIGVITLISVQERTKEIGILRSLGASKMNVSSMFNAETVMIGFASGSLGVIITRLLCIPVNAILHHVTGLGNLSAYLEPRAALMLIGVSVFLTVIAGLIPARSAAKKDPVVALRTE
ncbi:MAG: ABC transporter ATP-binding protein/permease [Bacillota bacterium]|nr:ABC transporter ATP-binding protein/permease [Bacillota bacterium]